MNPLIASTQMVMTPAPADEQERLDDLHPGGALHAADEHVEDHERADDGDDERLADLVADAEQQRHESARTGHLREQVEEAHASVVVAAAMRTGRLLEAERQHVGHRELARVAHQLGDEQQGDEPRDEEADRVEEPVVPVDRDRADDAEERCRRQVVAGDRGAVLRPVNERPAA